jgi:CubicO group peptidase (beta-lactamase class C family)
MKKYFILIFLFMFLVSNTFCQTDVDSDLKQLDEYYEGMVKDWDVPGLSIGIVKNGKIIFSGNYSVLEEGGNNKPDNNTLYAIASNSKAFTSAIIGMLIQEGKLDWDDRVKKYLPYFELYDPWVSSQVTICDLLCHRVGLGTYSGDLIWYKSDLTSEEIIKRVSYLTKNFDFRSGFGYTNIMYITAGEIIKQVSGKSWSENVKERILKPLGMERTITSPKDLKNKGNYANPHARKDNVNIPIPWEDWEEIGAAGGIISCINDLSKWMIFNLNHGIWGKDTLLTKATRNKVWTPHNNFIVNHTIKNDFNRHFDGYGLGWDLYDYHGRFLVGHGGGAEGMITAITLVPDENLGIVVLTNGMRSPIRAATYYAIDKLLGVNNIDWSQKYLARFDSIKNTDIRISRIKEKRIANTTPSFPLEKYVGTYASDIYGNIIITLEKEQLRLNFEHSPNLAASLNHWHYDVWEINWNKIHAWFDFGTIKFSTNNNHEIIGIEFNVPNDDIFFEELKPYKIKTIDIDK